MDAPPLARVAMVRPDVVLMDIDMPGKDGIAVTAELHAMAPVAPSSIVSMQDDSATRARPSQPGPPRFVGKHEIDAALTTAIRAAASRPRRPERLRVGSADRPPR